MQDMLPKPRLQKGQKYCRGCGVIIRAKSAKGRKRSFCSRSCYDGWVKKTNYDRTRYDNSSINHTIYLFNLIKNHIKRINEIKTFTIHPQAKMGALYREERMYRSALKELNTIGKSLTPSQRKRFTAQLEKAKKGKHGISSALSRTAEDREVFI